MNLKEATVFVTGGNRGLGLAFAKEALQRGARKVYVGVRDPESFNLDLPGLHVIKIDVTDPTSIRRAVNLCADVNILVNNAGIVRLLDGALDPALIEQSKEIFDTNYYGVIRTTQAFAAVLESNSPSAIVNVISDAAWVSVPILAAYAASKHAVWSFTNALRIQVKPSNIEVLALHVGFLDTDMTAAVDVPKSDPNIVAAATWDALGRGACEYLGDSGTKVIKESLSSEVAAYLNPSVPF